MVAEKAGVSRGTVDRVLNNRSHVSPDVYARVLSAIEEIGYLAPRQVHQSVLVPDSFPPIKVGVLIPNWTGHFRSEILRGIDAARSELSDFHVEIILEECETDIPGEVVEIIDKMIAQNIQGLAICAVNAPTIEAKVSSLISQNIPVITFNSDLPESKRLCFIGQDYNKSGRIAAELMSKCIPASGKILAAVGNLEFYGHRMRLQGFYHRMEELHFPKQRIITIETFNNYQATYRKVTDILAQSADICAIYMANRSVAGCTEAVKAAGKQGQLRIICHDTSESTKRLLLDGSIDFTISHDIFHQGYLPLIYLRHFLHKGQVPDQGETNTNISIICSQNYNTE